MKKIHLICAARPNFMKIAPLYHALKNEPWCKVEIVHTGQHYDYQMSQVFFDDFGLPSAHYYLGIGSGSHAEQTAQTMIAYEKLCLEKSRPDLVIVVGDVNATLACSIAAKKIHLTVAHLEAGLRSFDRTMPEEINRIVTDSISDICWTPSQGANDNLIREGVAHNRIKLVGNIMIDTYCMLEKKIDERNYNHYLGVGKKQYGVLTLHRPVNVDTVEALGAILNQIGQIDLSFILPLHPRTKKTFEKLDIVPRNLKLIEPLRYIDFMSLVSQAACVVSDSGGVQEETTYLGVPCFTLRKTTERPITVLEGTNQLVSPEDLLDRIKQPKLGRVPHLWDGKTAKRITEEIKDVFKTCT